MFLLSLLLPLLALAADSDRGYPLFYGSFKNVGDSATEFDVLPLKLVDDKITQWTTDCPADAFVLIRDATPFQLTGLKKMQRLAEYSLTRGSVLTDSMVDLRELALDLEEYCDGNLYDVLPDTDPASLPRPVNTVTRIYYVEFDKDASAEIKEYTLTEVLGRLSTPFVTVLYTSSFPQTNPILRSVQTNPQRYEWEKHHLEHKRDHITPIIAPLFSKHQRLTGHAAPEAGFDLPENFFKTLFLGSLLAVGFMAYRDFTRSRPAKKPVQAEKSKKQE